jgi:hypothetical protein
MIDTDIEFRIGFAPILRVAGVNECVADPSLVTMTGTQKFATIPIQILSQDTVEVKFSVMQSWLDHPACYVATDYVSTTNIETCERAVNVAPGEIDTFTALCSNGVAQVTIYVHSSDFDAIEDDAAVPARCKPVGEGQTVAYTFHVPCGLEEGTDACEPTPELTCAHFDSHIISSEDFEMPEQAQSWLFALRGLASSLDLSADSPEVSKTFEVPMDSSEITLEFDFYETADQASDNEAYLRINDVYLDLVSFISGTSEGIKMGTFGELEASITISGNNHNVQLTIPATWYPVGRLTLGFKVPTSLAEAISFDNVVLSSACARNLAISISSVDCPTGGGETEISFEDFENKEADTWGGLESAGGGFTSFLGRLGRENPKVSKEFPVPTGAGSVLLAFDFYIIDGFSQGDKAYVTIAGTSIDLGLLDSGSGTANSDDITVTKTKSSKQNIGSTSELDQKFQLEVTIPARWFTSGRLEIGFKVQMLLGTDETSAGIDNIRLTAVCDAVQRRDLEQAVLSQTLPVAEPDMYADDGGYYCSAEDFPCEGAGNVHICHYDARRGYQTFCLPEADSEVLRFYSYDYCGACVEGYNRINMN